MTKTLLPPGCYDVLPPQAHQESELSHTLLSVFESFGYEQVSPPLLEYSENLLAGRGAVMSPQIFRVMDPSTNKVMGIRADMTLQIARIATSRMNMAPRPLRLCYNGLILRMQNDDLRGGRQLRQAGIELIGAASPEADAEVIFVAAEALKRAGIPTLSIDLNLPGIVGSLLAAEKLGNEEAEALFSAITHKDIAAIQKMKFGYRNTLIGLLQCAGPAQGALAAIERLDLPESAKLQFRNLKEVVQLLGKPSQKNWELTIDATESRGLAYHSGIGFSIFVSGAACEVGRGGRYLIEGAPGGDTEATGFTLYVETLMGLLPEAKRQKRILVEGGIGIYTASLRADGYAVVHALAEYGASAEEAKRLGCEAVFKDGKIKNI